jgi:hypothetical protein
MGIWSFDKDHLYCKRNSNHNTIGDLRLSYKVLRNVEGDYITVMGK